MKYALNGTDFLSLFVILNDTDDVDITDDYSYILSSYYGAVAYMCILYIHLPPFLRSIDRSSVVLNGFIGLNINYAIKLSCSLYKDFFII